MKPVAAAVAAILLTAAGCQTTATSSPPASAAEGAAGGGPELAPAGYAPPKPGTIVVGRREDGTLETSRVIDTDGFQLRLEREGERIVRVPFCYYCGPLDAYPIETERYEALWPLEVGKSVTFQRRRARDGATWIQKASVVGTETVTTELGTFETFVIEQSARGAGTNRWRGTRTQWFAPEIGWTVKSEWWASDGASGTWEIASIALPQ